jgi:hypothetical protein
MTDAVQAFRAISWLILKWLLIASAALIVLVAAGVGIYFANEWYTYGRHAAQVQPWIRIDPELCKTGGYPLFIGFTNKSDKTVDRVWFGIVAKVPGHSTNVSDYKTLSSDKIIKPDEGFGTCYSLPKLSTDELPSTLEWSLRDIRLQFSK